ncbi:MAG TPA: fibronectin type III domain-containing protein [Bacteriovoracaceae bacterium]|nr:fibronectin type III domain-containing protein [Bacteriovoracaceae bacterium]
MFRKLLFYSFVMTSFMKDGICDVPAEALIFETDLKIYNSTSTEYSKIRAAEDHIKRVIASEQFKDAVINHTYIGVKRFVDNDGLSNEQIYQKILDGAETLYNVKNNTMNMEVEMYYEDSSTIGHTYTSSPRIYANSKYYDNYSSTSVTANLMHEWLHKIGFKHAVSYSTSRDYSVPYAVGGIMVRLANSSALYISAPTNLRFSTSPGQVTLSWDGSKAVNGVREYKVYRTLVDSSTTYVQGTTTSTTFTQNKPTQDAVYYVRAYDVDGKSSRSADVSYESSYFLNRPTNLSVGHTRTSATLTWAAATSSEGVKEYKIYRKLDSSTSTYYQGSTTSLIFTQTLPSTGARYFVKVVDRLGKTASSLEVSLDYLMAPENLTISKTTSSVTLRWSSGKASNGFGHYKIYRMLVGSSYTYLQGTTTSLSFTQSKPSSNAVYYVKIVDDDGDSASSPEVLYSR